MTITSGSAHAVVAIQKHHLNALLAAAIGDALVLPPSETQANIPMLGMSTLKIFCTLSALEIEPVDEGKLRITATTMQRLVLKSESMALPEDGPALPIRIVAELEPDIFIDANGVVHLHLNDRVALTTLEVELDKVPADDQEAQNLAQAVGMMMGMAQQMLPDLLKDTVGEKLVFANMSSAFRTAGLVNVALQVREDGGAVVLQLGVLPAATRTEIVDASATSEPTVMVRCSNEVINAGLATVVGRLSGGLPIPFELQVEGDLSGVGATVKAARLMPSLPDLRPGLRWETETRLVDEKIVVGLKAAWLEMPSLLGSFVNAFNRQVGSLAGWLNLKLRLPSQYRVAPEVGPPWRFVITTLQTKDQAIELSVNAQVQTTPESEGSK